MSAQRERGEYIVCRRLTGLPDLARLRTSLCGLLFDAAPRLVVSVLLFLDEVCLNAFDSGDFPVLVTMLRATDPHYLRIDIRGPRLVPPRRPDFMDIEHAAAGWGVTYDGGGTGVWAYLTLPMPEPARVRSPWSQLAMCLPRNPTLN
ncbi:MAG TPA: hypothetical protein VHC18_15090 [Amycolatopsis sp.]|nr:hypothetical protein [Amycolatopsis sp.]